MIKFVVLAIALACDTVICQRKDGILRSDFETPDELGNYRWALQTEGGIYHEQRGQSDGRKVTVEGQYQYEAPEGQIIRLQYAADENGFQPIGAHLPTPPPTPAAILRAIEYIRSTANHSN